MPAVSTLIPMPSYVRSGTGLRRYGKHKDSLAGWTGSSGWPHRQTCCLGQTGRLAGTAAKIRKREKQGSTGIFLFKCMTGQWIGKYDRQVDWNDRHTEWP